MSQEKASKSREVPMARKALNTREAAVAAGVSVATIRSWLKRGLNHFRPGGTGHIRIEPKDLEEFVRRQAEGAQSNA